MRRPLIITAFSGAVLFAVTSPAAAGGPGGYNPPQVFQTATQGTGSAQANGEADGLGNLSATSSATGGTKTLIPILNLLPYSSPSSGVARSTVSDGGTITEEGVYEVTVTYAGADTDEAATGNGVAEGRALATAFFEFPGSGGELSPVASEAVALPSEPGSVVLQFEVTLPGPGQFSIQAEIQALSSANGTGYSASTESSGQVTEISYAQVG